MAEEQPSNLVGGHSFGWAVTYLAAYYGAKKWPIARRRHTDRREPGELHDVE